VSDLSDRSDPTPPAPTLITVVIPVHNRRDLLARTLASLARQHHDDFETIVVDDGSDEPLDDVVAAANLRDVHLLAGPRRGAGHARNTGAEAARGRWLTFLDSDDEADPGWLSTMLDLLETRPNGVGFCAARRCRDGVQLGVEHPRPLLAEHPAPVLFLAGAFVLPTALFRSLGGYDVSLPAAQHTDLGYRVIELAERGGNELVVIDVPLLTLHMHDGGNIRSDPHAVAEGAIAMIAKHERWLRGSPATLANYYAVAGVSTVKAGDPTTRARSYFWRAVRAEPTRPTHWGRLLTTLVPGLARRRWTVG
jgi:glycosyltransferase involved in cell wall biosynthesis